MLNIHTVVLPDGRVATRKSKTRTYSHAVVLTETHEDRVRDLERLIRGNLEAAAERPANAQSFEAQAQFHRDQIAELEAGDREVRFGVLSWHSSEALAHKAAAAAHWHPATKTVVEVDLESR